jgi:uncharacterized protein (DUF983 family)
MNSESPIIQGHTCPKCGYDLEGLKTDDSCPECGIDIDIHDLTQGIERFEQPGYNNALFMAVCASVVIIFAWPLIALVLQVPPSILFSTWIAIPVILVIPLYLCSSIYKGSAIAFNWPEQTIVFERSYRHKGLIRGALRKRYHKCRFDYILTSEIMYGRAYSIVRVITIDGSATLPDSTVDFNRLTHILEELSENTPKAPLFRRKTGVYILSLSAMFLAVAATLFYFIFFDPV